VTVEFIKFDAPYRVGDRKECTPGEAAKLIKSGVARKVSVSAPRAPANEPGVTFTDFGPGTPTILHGCTQVVTVAPTTDEDKCR